MGKAKNPELENEQTVTDEPIIVKGPLRDDPEPEYVPAWEVVNDRQNILTDKIPPKIFSLEAMVAAGVVNEENLAAYLEDNGYVKNTDIATTSDAGVVKVSVNYGSNTSQGFLCGATRTNQQYTSGTDLLLISKGTLENAKTDVTARALVDIAAAQITTPVAGTYTVKLTYDGAAWGVTIIQDT